MKFSYFGVMAKGLPILLALEEHDIAYEGNSVGFEAWGPMKESGICAFGQLPLLETPEHGAIVQSGAILQYIGNVKNCGGKDIREQARNDMLMGAADDFFGDLGKFQPTVFEKEKSSAEETEKMWAGSVAARFGLTETFIAGKDRFTDSGNSTGELALFSVFHQMVVIEGKENVLDKYPGLKAFYTRVKGLKGVQTVLAGKSSFGVSAPYFIKRE